MKKYFNIIEYEVLMRIREQAQYKVELLSETIMFIFIYLATIISNWGNNFITELGVTHDTSVKLVFIGYTIWQIGIIALGYSSSFVKNEAARGILEIKQQSIFSYQFLLFIRMCISVFTSILVFLCISFVLSMIDKWRLTDFIKCCKSIFPGLISIIGMFGIGLIFGALTLHEKSIGQSVLILQTVLLFFSNIFTVSTAKVMKFIPYIIGIDIGRKLFLDNHILKRDIFSYIGINVAWFIFGNLIFRKAQKLESKIGMFDNY